MKYDSAYSNRSLRELEKNTNELVKYAITAMTDVLNRDHGALRPDEASIFVALINLLNANKSAIEELANRVDRIDEKITTTKA